VIEANIDAVELNIGPRGKRIDPGTEKKSVPSDIAARIASAVQTTAPSH
jgi:hypothetical protein